MKLSELFEGLFESTEIIAWHGSDNRFDKFENKPSKSYIMMSEVDVERNAFFFAYTKEYAENFGKYVKPYRIRIDKNFKDCSPSLASEILKPLIEFSNGKYYFNDGYMTEQISQESIKDNSWLKYCFKNGNLNWEALDFPEIVSNMKQHGFDSVNVMEDDNVVTLAVFDSDRIIPA